MDALIALLVFAVLTAIVLIAIYRALRKRAQVTRPDNLDAIPPSKPRDPENETWFRISIAIVLAVGTYLMIVPDSRAAEAVKQKPRTVLLNLADCPPSAPGMTPIVVFVINTESDLRAPRGSCARIAERPFKPKRPQRASAIKEK